ncbi:OmpA family protein [Prevotella sp. Rep29]|uniref:OmpA family protein n=1 Tax=Prevotella sp. Rep29 TaxID=2691580 RepID=UPI001C6E3AF2|nr:OmpA family protein [Prevotella sp. Rep29]QYR10243.1 OmpA family protein [Prevotella sp. Rep29]
MKKLVLFFAAAAMAVTASAQVTVEGSKFSDNWSIGIQGGLATKTTQNRWLSNTNPNAGLRLTKEITPVFGLVAEGIVYFNDRAQTKLMDRLGQTADYDLTARSREVRTNTFAKALNVNLLAKVNLSNLFGGYKGEPRTFEVSALYGFGWGKGFGRYNRWDQGESGFYGSELAEAQQGIYDYNDGANELNSKAALNFAFNLGAAKAVQIFVEPSITFSGLKDFKYNVDRSTVQLNAGVVYKFKNSNGTHNFKLARLYDQDEIDRLNGIINDLRNRKPEVKEVIKEVVKEVPVGKEVRVDDLVFVTFAQGKSTLTADAKKALDGVKEGAHVQIVGTASPEGPAALNQKLSENRANVVAEYLKGRGVIVDEAVGKGVQGNTSNRLAIVYVK